MPSAFSHAISAIAIGSMFKNNKDRARMTFLGVICSVLPDADVLSFQFGVSYSSMWGHRGISHSIFFALLLFHHQKQMTLHYNYNSKKVLLEITKILK